MRKPDAYDVVAYVCWLGGAVVGAILMVEWMTGVPL